MGAFGQWEVPLYYSTILEEHDKVRHLAGLFDISHMGVFWFSGKGAVAFLDHLLPRSVPKMSLGQAIYNPLLNEQGGFVDDIILYRFEAERFCMIVNADNVAKDYAWIHSKLPADVHMVNTSDEKGLLALQGPMSAAILDEAFPVPGENFGALKNYHFKSWRTGMVTRTGYTGEDGFEILVSLKELEEVWDTLLRVGKPKGLTCIGFGARDTLRFEAAMLLYGHDMNDQISPLEAGVSWAVDLTKPSFIGREALIRQKEKGLEKRWVGLEMLERGIPRQGYEIMSHGKKVGVVTSGSFSPTFKKNLALGYVSTALAGPGTELEILIRDKQVKAKVVSLPFYRRKK